MSGLRERFEGVIDTLEELTTYHGAPNALPQAKLIDHLDQHCRDFIARSPFFTLATSDLDGRCDVSPRGGPAGFVEVLDPKHLAFADAKGNRLADSMRNMVQTGRAGLLFLIPTLSETLRVNGRAVLTRDPELLARHEVIEGKPPRIVIVLEVEEAFLHCAKAFIRSELWEPSSWTTLEGLARPAQIWKDHAELHELPVQDLEDQLAVDYSENLYWEPREAS